MKKKKERKKERKKKTTFNGGGRIRTQKLWITKLAPYHWATETNCNHIGYKYVFIFNMASRTIRPSTCAIPQFQFWFKKNLTKCIYKVVNVSKSQYYEFRHNIMNLGNQNSKYLWRIWDLENPQTGTQFANSVLMYKILCNHGCRCWQR